MNKTLFNFIKKAYAEGLCDDYKNEIRAIQNDNKKLVELALRQQSIPFVATKIYGSNDALEYIKKEWAEYINGAVLSDCDGVDGYLYAWYVSCDYRAIVAVSDVVHVSHTSNANFAIPECNAITLYVSNDSDINIICDGYNFVRVYLFDKSRVNITDADPDSKIIVYKYSDECDVTQGRFCLGVIKEYRKELRL